MRRSAQSLRQSKSKSKSKSKKGQAVRFLLLLLLLLLLGSAATAAEYRFSPGDVIEVTVRPQQGYDRTITVQPDGRISFPILGQLQAAGLTVAELTEKLRDGLNRDLIDPRVTVSLRDLSRQALPRVSVLGAVRIPGVVELRQGATVAEALAAAGGPVPIADLRRVMVTRADRTMVTVNLAEAERSGRLDGNVALAPGDLVVVPEGPPPTALVLGEVARPGPVDLRGEMRLLDAISQTGGPTAKADLRRITLARLGVAGTQTLDLSPLLTGGSSSELSGNVLLQPGDTIVLKETDQQIYILGRVVRPDVYPLKPNERLLDALARAGGAAGDGDIGRLVLVRRDEKGQPAPKLVDVRKMMAKGALTGNELLRPGDVLFVPDKKARRSALDYANLVYPLTGFLSFLKAY